METLYVTDLDGTLLNRSERISEYSINVINEYIKKGMHFTYATARSLSSASIVTSGLVKNIPVIVYNGAFIMNSNTGEVLHSTAFSKCEKQYIINILKENRISPIVYSFIDGKEKVSWLTNLENEGKKHYFNSRKGDKRLNPLEYEDNLFNGEVFYFTCIGEKEELLPVYNSLKDNKNYNCIFQKELYREEYWCEIMPSKATKANAIKKLKELWSCDKVVSFGDAINDIPMFKISDECYAVENAVDELKRAATAIIKSNEEDGVAKWLESNFSLEL